MELAKTANFLISVEKTLPSKSYAIDHLTIKVFVDRKVLYQEVHKSGPFTELGTHRWWWGGLDSSGVYDTKRLAGKEVQILVAARHYPLASGDFGQVNLTAEKSGLDWLDGRIDTQSKTVEMNVRIGLDFRDETARSHADKLSRLVKQGIEHYWSRKSVADGLVIDSTPYVFLTKVDVVGVEDGPCLPFNVYWDESKDGARSHNSGIITGRLHYNNGINMKRSGIDTYFTQTVAHEFGHSILENAISRDWSWKHKLSTVFQTPHPWTPEIPTTGEIDLMLYYKDGPKISQYDRVRAVDVDLAHFLSLARTAL